MRRELGPEGILRDIQEDAKRIRDAIRELPETLELLRANARRQDADLNTSTYSSGPAWRGWLAGGVLGAIIAAGLTWIAITA